MCQGCIGRSARFRKVRYLGLASSALPLAHGPTDPRALMPDDPTGRWRWIASVGSVWPVSQQSLPEHLLGRFAISLFWYSWFRKPGMIAQPLPSLLCNDTW